MQRKGAALPAARLYKIDQFSNAEFSLIYGIYVIAHFNVFPRCHPLMAKLRQCELG
jgi:hypothetical protein